MTQRPGDGSAGSSPGRKRGPQGRGPRSSAGRDDKSGPGAARPSGRPAKPTGKGSTGKNPTGKAESGKPPAGRTGRQDTTKSSTTKSSTTKSSTAKNGTTKNGPAKKAPAKTASGKAAKSGPSKTGSSKTGKSKTASGKGTPAASAQGRPPARPPKGAGGRPGRSARPKRGGGGSGPRGPRRHRGFFDRSDPLKRLNIGLLAVAFVLSLFAGRLVQLQTIDDERYAELALRQRVEEIELPALRGDITDANGNPFAMTVEARSVFVDPSIIEPAKRQELVNALAPTLGLNPGTVMKALAKPDDQFEVLAHGVRLEKARMIEKWGFTGVGTLPEYRREYPNDTLGANVVGFVNDSGGAVGVEAAKDDVLAGRDGWQRVELSLDGQHIPMGKDQKKAPVPGQGVRLTLLQDLQYKAQQAIRKQVEASGADSGSVMVLEPRTGKILAMASAPGFDPNDPGAVDSARWGNPLVQNAFEPGSTGKVATAAAVMEHGGVTPLTPFEVPDRVRRYDRVFSDSHPHPTERLTFAGVLAKSSNVGTILASERIPQERLYKTLREFGFGEKIGLPLPGETSGMLRPPDQWSGVDRYTIAFGQGMSVNAVQMASVYATIANGGVRVEPHLVAGTVDENDEFAPAAEPESRRVVSARTAQQISDMLEGVTTDDGTAPKAQVEGYRVAGKTGTAERVNPETGTYEGGGYTTSFAGFAPADDPRLVVQVVVQNPRRGSHYGGDVAAPVFRDVMSFALQTKKIPPTGSEPPKIRIYARD